MPYRFYRFFQQPTSSSSTAMDACCSFCVLLWKRVRTTHIINSMVPEGSHAVGLSPSLKPLVLTLTLVMKLISCGKPFFHMFFGSNITLFFSWLVGLGLRWAFCRISWSSSSARLQKISWAMQIDVWIWGMNAPKMLIFTGKWGTILINHVVKGRFKTWCVQEMWGSHF